MNRLPMRPPRSLKLILAIVLVIAGTLAGAWYVFQPQVYDTIRQVSELTVYEGLPHPMYEETVFEKELKTKPTSQLSGFPFYQKPLKLKAEDIKRLRDLLGSRKTYQAYSGEQKCGGFHPDFAVEWSFEGKLTRVLLCFGCSEARFDTGSRSQGGEVKSGGGDFRMAGRQE